MLMDVVDGKCYHPDDGSQLDLEQLVICCCDRVLYLFETIAGWPDKCSALSLTCRLYSILGCAKASVVPPSDTSLPPNPSPPSGWLLPPNPSGGGGEGGVIINPCYREVARYVPQQKQNRRTSTKRNPAVILKYDIFLAYNRYVDVPSPSGRARWFLYHAKLRAFQSV